MRNGKLLALIEGARFDAFITADKNLEYQQAPPGGRPFAILLLSTNHLPTIIPQIGKIGPALDAALPGQVTKVDRGKFLPTRMRRPGTPST